MRIKMKNIIFFNNICRRIFPFFVSGILLSFVLVSCPDPFSPPVRSIVLDGDFIMLGDFIPLRPGEEIILTPTIFPDAARNNSVQWSFTSPHNASITFYSAVFYNGEIIRGDEIIPGEPVIAGRVIAVADGNPGDIAEIIVSSDEIRSESLTVVVIYAVSPVTSVRITANAYIDGTPPVLKDELVRGDLIELFALIGPYPSFERNVIWESAVPSIVDVIGNKLIATATAVDEGSATITATVENEDGSVVAGSLSITVIEPFVRITPYLNVTVPRGYTRQFTADVRVVQGAPNTVTWDISGAGFGTGINYDGLLTVSVNEPVGALLGIRATSTHDDTIYDTVWATVVEPAPAVISVTVTPGDATVEKGGTQQFTANVVVVHGAPQTVTWAVSGNYSSNTQVDYNGILTVAADETATTLTVTAESTHDNTKYDTATVTVTDPPAVISVTVTPSSATVERGDTQQFTADVVVVQGAPQTVTWSVNGNYSSYTQVDYDGLLTVAADEAANTLTVTAISTHDNSRYGSAAVTVIDP